MSYLLKKSNLPEKQSGYNHKIEVSARNLLRIIDDILDFSKIEAGKLTLESTNLYLDELISEVADAVNVKLQQKSNVELVTSIDPSIPNTILGDSVRLRQVLLNLADNATKFTESGEIHIAASLQQSLPYGVIIRFSVKDSGIGITPEQLSKLFAPFQQADISTTRKFGGTGLGLVICRKIVEMMDGELLVNSAYGEGSEFYFHAFFSLSQTDSAVTSASREMRGLKALLVDDSESARLVLHEMLSSQGFTVIVAKDAYEAIELFEVEQKSQHPLSLLVVDWKMPGMDGLQLVRELRSREGYDVPSVLMVTAYGIESMRDAAKQKLVDGVLLKPINSSTLHDTISSLLNKKHISIDHSSKEEISVESFHQELKGTRLLLVEDNEVNLDLAIELLNDVGIQPDIARNGQEAVDKVRSQEYQVVLMDIQMPVMDGISATKVIRTELQNRDLPILAMTAHAMKGEREKSLAAGMNDHITKPIDTVKLYQSIIYHVKGKAVTISDQAATSAEAPSIVIIGLDTSEGLKRVGNKEASYLRLLETFLNNYRDTSAYLKHLEQRNTPALSLYLHTIAGVSGNIGAKMLYELAYPLSVETKQLVSDGITQITDDQLARMHKVESDLKILLEQIQQFIDAKANATQAQASISQETFTSILLQVGELAAQQDVASADLCEKLINENALSEEQLNQAKACLSLLNAFEFDEASALISSYSFA
ncbi:MAG: hypothetical protein RLZZ543_88, partial [Bacteroidota bacterium]